MFDLNRFEQKFLSQFTGKATGFGYAVFQNGIPVKQGAAGYAVVASQKKMTADTPMTTTSMTKSITAVSVLRAMEIMRQKGSSITVDSLIAPYLPQSWGYTSSGHVGEMTFRHLLTHTSGLRSMPNDEDLFDSLSQTIANGSMDENWQKNFYQNCNFSIMRILVPNMLNGVSVSAVNDVTLQKQQVQALQAELQSASPQEKPGLAAQIKVLNAQIDLLKHPDIRTAKLYFDFVRAEVFTPLGMGDVSLAPKDASETIYYYNFYNTSNYRQDYEFDWYQVRLGSGHWFLSPVEYGKFLDGFRLGKIVGMDSVNLMFDGQLGIDSVVDVIDGKSYAKNGGFTVNNCGQGGAYVMLPNGLSAVCMMNSAGGMHKPIEDAFRQAYDATFMYPGTTTTPIVASSLNGRISVFTGGVGNRIYTNSANDGQPFEGWNEVEGFGLATKALAAASLNGHRYLFAKGDNDHKIYYNTATPGEPFGWWKEVQGNGTTDVSLAACPFANCVYVFAKGMIDNRVYINSAPAGGSFAGWKGVEGNMITDASLAAAPLGVRVYVFAKGVDGLVYVNSAVNGQVFDGWGKGWTPLPGCITDAAPAASTVGNRIYVFVKGTDTKLYLNTALDGQPFEGWRLVEGNGTTDVAPGAASMNNRVYLFAKGVNDHRIYANSAIAGKPFDGYGNGWAELPS